MYRLESPRIPSEKTRKTWEVSYLKPGSIPVGTILFQPLLFEVSRLPLRGDFSAIWGNQLQVFLLEILQSDSDERGWFSSWDSSVG